MNMPWRCFGLCLLLTAWAAGVQADDGHTSANLLQNAGFEAGRRDAAEAWRFYDWRGESTITLQPVSPGMGQSLVVRLPDAQARATVSQPVSRVDLKAGTMLRIAARVRAQGVKPGDNPVARIEFKGRSDNHELLSYGSLPLEPSEEWQHVQVDTALKHDVRQLTLHLLLQRQGGAWYFDDVSLAVVDPTADLKLFSLKQSAAIIDGRLDEPYWTRAQRTVGMIHLNSTEPADQDTQVMSVYDNGGVTFAARVFDDRMDQIQTDADQPWNGDCIELFMSPALDRSDLYQLVIDADANTVLLHHTAAGTRQIHTSVEVATHHHDDHWSVEVHVPFALLGTDVPEDNQRWLFNIGRERYIQIGGEREQQLSSWAKLNTFLAAEQFGHLAFYSRHVIDADLVYWDNNDRDPLMDRPVVSGIEIAMRTSGIEAEPSLWTYRPFEVEQEHAESWDYRGLTEKVRQERPEFYRTAMALNQLLIDKTHADLALAAARRAGFYAGGVDHPELNAQKVESDAIDTDLNTLYRRYGRVYDDGGEEAQFTALLPDIGRIAQRIEALANATATQTAAFRGELHAAHSDMPTSEMPSGRAGAEKAELVHLAHEFFHNERALLPLGDGQFAAHSLHPLSSKGTSEGPGETYHFQPLTDGVELQHRRGILRSFIAWTLAGLHDYCMPIPPWLAERIESDPDILLRSQDGQVNPEYQMARNTNKRGVNPNNPQVQQFIGAYMEDLARATVAAGDFRYILTGNETKNWFSIIKDGKKVDRVVGFNPSGLAAFREYLRDRYEGIGELNKAWGTRHASFDDIQPPDDKYITEPSEPSPLRYEHERWTRVNHVRFLARIYDALKRGAPDAAVFVDPSYFLLEMNGYLMYREGVGDIYSTHSIPANDEPMWVYLRSLNRHFGTQTGYYENYFGMYRVGHMADERLAKRDLYQMSFSMFMHDVRTVAWWLRYSAQPTQRLVAYNNNPFALEFGQTIYRWSTTAIPGMIRRGEQIEPVLLDSEPEPARVAIVQPCASIYHLSSLGVFYRTSPTIQNMLDLQRHVLRQTGVSHEYLIEEMWQDGRVTLDEYQLLILPHAPFLSRDFATALLAWVEGGGTLITMGPAGLFDPMGQPNVAMQRVAIRMDAGVEGLGGSAPWVKNAEGLPWRSPSSQPFHVAAHGSGRIVMLTEPLARLINQEDRLAALRRVIVRAAPPTVASDHPAIRTVVRVASDGRLYVGVSNTDVERPAVATLRVQGTVAAAHDLLADGCPIPVDLTNNAAELRVHLAPGDWTLISLVGASASTPNHDE